MKSIFLLAICSTLSLAGYSQSISVGIEQLTTLETLGQTIYQGYRIVTPRLQSINEIQTHEVHLHSAYIASLDTLQPSVSADARLSSLLTRLQELITQLTTTLDYWQKQPALQQ